MLDLIAQTYVEATRGWLATAGLSHELAHVHAGLGLYLIGQFLFRDRRGSIRALQLVLAVEIANEVLGFIAYGDLRAADTARDMLMTMFWPVAIYAMSVIRRRRWEARSASAKLAANANPLAALSRTHRQA